MLNCNIIKLKLHISVVLDYDTDLCPESGVNSCVGSEIVSKARTVKRTTNDMGIIGFSYITALRVCSIGRCVMRIAQVKLYILIAQNIHRQSISPTRLKIPQIIKIYYLPSISAGCSVRNFQEFIAFIFSNNYRRVATIPYIGNSRTRTCCCRTCSNSFVIKSIFVRLDFDIVNINFVINFKMCSGKSNPRSTAAIECIGCYKAEFQVTVFILNIKGRIAIQSNGIFSTNKLNTCPVSFFVLDVEL